MTAAALSPRHDEWLRLVLAAGEPVQPGALDQLLQASRPTINRAWRRVFWNGWGTPVYPLRGH